MVRNKIYYAGIGSRVIPVDIKQQMVDLGTYFAHKGLILRSGGAYGSDMAFENGCDEVQGEKEIFLPWKGLNGNRSKLCTPSLAAMELAANLHPLYYHLSMAARKLIGRNVHQILGEQLDIPVSFVVCYTPDKCESHLTYSKNTGGTGTAISLASQHQIPIFNLANKNRYWDCINFVEKLLERLDGKSSEVIS